MDGEQKWGYHKKKEVEQHKINGTEKNGNVNWERSQVRFRAVDAGER
jgi:hypothetical protein